MPATDLWDAVSKTTPLSPVRYEFRLDEWKGAPWHVLRVELVEALNSPYRLTLELVVDEPRLDIDDLLGDACTFEVDRGGDARTVHGLVLAADDLGRAAGRHHVRLEIVPALALLAQIVDTRAWQDLTAIDILRLVLTPGLAEYGRTLDLKALRLGDYPRRDYCVQFRESDLAFAARLMEEEGITYYFDHDGGKERLVLVDDNRDLRPLQRSALNIFDTEPDTAPAESIQRFAWGRRLGSTAVAQRNFDWSAPGAPFAAVRAGTDRRGRNREVYEHDDIIYPGDGPRHAQIKQERLAVAGHLSTGASNATGLSPGVWFALAGHARSELDDRYVITRVIHRGHSPDVAILMAQSDGARYTNEFECIPLKEPHRPPLLHHKPRVSGLQTAIVTGPPGEEVHCDEYGRIKVLPHWDRVSPRDETSSFWIRVSQSVAGGSWGMFALPRIGQEVVVDFLDGDPDRPLVVGSVYNGANTPPYPLPAEKTKTTIKSNSSPGGGGSNELRFEDQAGGEEVYLHAQKDWNSVVGANKTLSVGGSESDSIAGSRSVTVGGCDSLTVGGSRSMTIGATLTETVGAVHTVTIGAAQINTIGAAQANAVTADQTNTIGATRFTRITGMDTMFADGGREETITGTDTKTVNGTEKTTVNGAKTEETESTTETVKGPRTLEADENEITIHGPQTTKVEGLDQEDVQIKSITADSKITLTVGCTSVEIGPGKVTITGAGEIVLDGGGTVTVNGGGAIKLNGDGEVEINGGGSVNINGDGDVNIKGGTINLNC